jgi:hypothetical protein
MTITAESLARAYSATGPSKFTVGDMVTSHCFGRLMRVKRIGDSGIWCDWWVDDLYFQHPFDVDDLEMVVKNSGPVG